MGLGTVERDEELDQVVIQGIAGRGTARGDANLAIDRGQVRVNGARADDELLGDLNIGQSGGE